MQGGVLSGVQDVVTTRAHTGNAVPMAPPDGGAAAHVPHSAPAVPNNKRPADGMRRIVLNAD